MILGWDIGGVNTKAARIAGDRVLAVESRPFELQHDPASLVQVLRALAADVGATPGDAHAVTMTAELSQMFRTKRDGVRFVLEAVDAAFPGATIRVYAVDGRFLSVAEAVAAPLAVAAANWVATARVVAQSTPDALLVDIGTTSTDVIPIVAGQVVAAGWTDPDRLASGELVYTGAVRTPVEAMAAFVPFRGGDVGISAEAFALSGDVHVWRGDLHPADYTTPTPDRRPATREFAGERLARAICADREMLDEAGVTAIADALADAQVARVAVAMAKVRERNRSLRTAVVTGLGAFIAARAAQQAGMDVLALSTMLGDGAARCAPAASVALLLAVENATPRGMRSGRPAIHDIASRPAVPAPARLVETVAKVGGGLLADEAHLDAVLAALTDVARHESLLIVPGGGPFADAVREQDARWHLSDDASHWMAILAMDQYAHLLASRMPGSVLVSDRSGIAAAIAARQIPVLAPYSWLRRDDPLPHSWDVTSDSLSAWIARQVGARRLVLIKPSGSAQRADLVDTGFHDVAGPLATELVQADAIENLQKALLP